MAFSTSIPFLTGTWLYSLTNIYANNEYFVLDSSTSDLYLTMSPTLTTLWQFCSAQDPSQYNICTNVTGINTCLNAVDSDDWNPHLAPPSFDIGQQWSILSWGDGTYKLINDLAGPTLYLDVFTTSKGGLLDAGNRTGQHWSFTRVGDVLPSLFCQGPLEPAVNSTRPSSVQSISTSNATQSIAISTPSTSMSSHAQQEPVPVPAPETSATSAHDTGVYVGIAVGVALPLASVLLVVLWFLRRRRQKLLLESEMSTTRQGTFPPTIRSFRNSSIKSSADPDSEPVSAVEEIISQPCSAVKGRDWTWTSPGCQPFHVETEGYPIHRQQEPAELPGQDWI